MARLKWGPARSKSLTYGVNRALGGLQACIIRILRKDGPSGATSSPWDQLLPDWDATLDACDFGLGAYGVNRAPGGLQACIICIYERMVPLVRPAAHGIHCRDNGEVEPGELQLNRT